MKKENIVKSLFIIYCIFIVIQFLSLSIIRDCFTKELNIFFFKIWNYSDWLINYEGGFVRRGLCGEIILFLYNTFNLDITQIIIFITKFTAIILIIFVIYFFYKKRLSFFLLPNVMLLGSFAMNNITSYRRDALMLLMIFVALYLYYRYHMSNKHRLIWYILLCTVSLLILLTHEASFFCFVPFIMLDYFSRYNQGDIISKSYKTLLFISPLIITMGFTCYYKGNEQIANNIWSSYAPYFNTTFGEMLPIGDGVNALTWSTKYASIKHLNLNYIMPIWEGSYIPRGFAWIFIFIFAIYLMINVNKIKLFNYEERNVKKSNLATIILIQLTSLLPMFTVLSCDFGRVFMYWSLTSFFIFSLYKKQKYFFFSTLGSKVEKLYKNNLFQKNWFYILISVSIMVPLWGFNDAIHTSVIGNIINIINNVLSHI